MPSIRCLLVSAVVTLLCACGAVPKVMPYAPLPGGVTATLTVVNDGLPNQFDFSATAFARSADCSSNLQFALVSDVKANRVKGSAHTTVIDANQPMSVGMMSMRSLGLNVSTAVPSGSVATGASARAQGL
jgi:hypothetical protein